MSVLGSRYVEEVTDIIVECGDKILMKYFKKADLSVERKSDITGYVSDVTEADLAADKFLGERLSALNSDILYVSEENVEEVYQRIGKRDLRNETYWIVDPLDGTSNFKNGSIEFGTHIGLVEKGEVVFGVIYFPAHPTPIGYYAIKNGGAYRFDGGNLNSSRTIQISSYDPTKLIRLGIQPQHFDFNIDPVTDAYGRENIAHIDTIEALKETRKFLCGSRMQAQLAEGDQDLYIMLMNPCEAGEWDIVPTILIVKEAGGFFLKADGTDIPLGTPHQKVPPYILANDRVLIDRFVNGKMKNRRVIGNTIVPAF